MDNSKLPKNQSHELNGNRHPRNLPGVYRHEAAGKEIITSADPNDGAVQADALVRVGYHRISDVPPQAEIKKALDARHAAEAKAAAEGKSPETSVPPAEPINGTTSPSVTTLEEEKQALAAELAETKATLAALQEGKKNEETKKVK